MTPTLAGRLQTRLIMLATVGVVWTAFLGLVIPRATGTALADQYRVLFTALLIVAAIGVVWELIYHALQQFRWEKDWPTLLGLLTAIPEGIVTWLVLTRAAPWELGDISGRTFLIMFVSLWILIWAVVNGPLQILLLRWRYRGGRFFNGW